MELLLDTHVLLWALSDPGRLASGTREAVADTRNRVVISAVTAWELAIKQSLGKLELPGPVEGWLPSAATSLGVAWIDISPADAMAVRALPHHHSDPFDRLLIVQAAGRGLTLVSHDRAMASYDVNLLWA